MDTHSCFRISPSAEQRMVYRNAPDQQENTDAKPPKGERVAFDPKAGEKPKLNPTEEQQKKLDENERRFDNAMRHIQEKIEDLTGKSRRERIEYITSEKFGKYHRIRETKGMGDEAKDWIRFYNGKIQSWDKAKMDAMRSIGAENTENTLVDRQVSLLDFGPSSVYGKMADLEQKYAGERHEPMATTTPERLQQIVDESLDALEHAISRYTDDPTAENRDLMIAALAEIDERVENEQGHREEWGEFSSEQHSRLAELRRVSAQATEMAMSTTTENVDKALKAYNPFDTKSINAALLLVEEEEGLRNARRTGGLSPVALSQQTLGLAAGPIADRSEANGRLSRLGELASDLQALPALMERGLADIRDILQRQATIQNRWNPEWRGLTENQVEKIAEDTRRLGRIDAFFRAHNATDNNPQMPQMRELATAKAACEGTLALQRGQSALNALADLKNRSSETFDSEAGKTLLQEALGIRETLAGIYRTIAPLPPSKWRDALLPKIAGTQVPDNLSGPGAMAWTGGAREQLDDIIQHLSIYDPDYGSGIEEATPEILTDTLTPQGPAEVSPEFYAADTDIPAIELTDADNPANMMRRQETEALAQSWKESILSQPSNNSTQTPESVSPEQMNTETTEPKSSDPKYDAFDIGQIAQADKRLKEKVTIQKNEEHPQ